MRIIIFIACVLFFFSSCNKNCYRDITEEEKNRLALRPGERIVFKSDSGFFDTLVVNSIIQEDVLPKEGHCKDEKHAFYINAVFIHKLYCQVYSVAIGTSVTSPQRKSKDFLYPELTTSFGYFVLNKSTPVTSLNINGHQLNNVYELMNLQPVDNPKVDRIYFSLQFGLVRMNFTNGGYWERQNF